MDHGHFGANYISELHQNRTGTPSKPHRDTMPRRHKARQPISFARPHRMAIGEQCAKQVLGPRHRRPLLALLRLHPSSPSVAGQGQPRHMLTGLQLLVH